MIIKLKVKPNARSNEINKIDKNYFEVKVTVPPEKGKANQKVIEILSKHFKIAKSKISITKGETSKEKLVEISID
jgi:uncharacterized protein (TIGR00251 family)